MSWRKSAVNSSVIDTVEFWNEICRRYLSRWSYPHKRISATTFERVNLKVIFSELIRKMSDRSDYAFRESRDGSIQFFRSESCSRADALFVANHKCSAMYVMMHRKIITNEYYIEDLEPTRISSDFLTTKRCLHPVRSYDPSELQEESSVPRSKTIGYHHIIKVRPRVEFHTDCSEDVERYLYV